MPLCVARANWRLECGVSDTVMKVTSKVACDARLGRTCHNVLVQSIFVGARKGGTPNSGCALGGC